MSTLPPEPEEPAVPLAEAPPAPQPGDAGETPVPNSETPGISLEGESAARRPGRSGWSVIALVPHEGREPPAGISEAAARSIWCALTAGWHPAILARAATLPRAEAIERPSPPLNREIRIIGGSLETLPSGYQTQAADAGAILIEAGTDRPALVRQIQEHLGAVGTPETSEQEDMLGTALDFFALGATRWAVEIMATAMSSHDAVNQEALARETLAAADAWQACDRPTAVNRLRAAFEVLTQGRERFYPVDAYLLDLCLLDPTLPPGALAAPLAVPVAVSLLACGQAIENQATGDPQRVAALRGGITEGWIDVAGGPFAEVELPLLPLESILWQFRRGGEAYRAHLDDRNVETFASRRFALFPQLPQIAKRFGFRFALHLGLDAGRFPVRPEPKRLWESPDGSSLEALFRPPLAADRSAQGLLVPWRLAATMRNDHVATLPLVHWPEPVAPWYLDLRRGATYSPVLGRWVTLNDYFHLTDRPYETFRPDPDLYRSPYLAQAVARGERRPISRHVTLHRLRGRLAAASAVATFVRAIGSVRPADPPAAGSEGEEERETSSPADEPLLEVESLLETGDHETAASLLRGIEEAELASLARRILGSSPRSSGDRRPGYLVMNSLGVPRRVPVLLPEASMDLRPEGPLRAAQFTDEGVWAVVDTPAFGFAWVPAEPDLGLPPAVPGGISARGRSLRNESMEVEVDAATGGLRGVMATGESTPRLAQQLVIVESATGNRSTTSRMVGERFDLDYAGPALLQTTTSGRLVAAGGQTLAAYQQRFRLWTGRPILELEITVSDLNPAWLERAAAVDPWQHYLACRWAWPDPSAMLRRSVLLAAELTEAERPETPDFFEISTRRQRTSLLFGGLAYQQRHGERMLDTLLVAGQETERRFRLGVALDLEQPFQAALDQVIPPLVVPVVDGPPPQGPRGWLMQLDHKAVAVTQISAAASGDDPRSWALFVHLLETCGQSARCRLRLFRNPVRARQVDFQGESIFELAIDGDSVLVDLTPHELARVEVTLG